MANKRGEALSYQPLRVDPVLSEGLIGVERDDGGIQRRVAAAFGRLADQAGQIGDEFAAVEGAAAGRQDALAGGPGAATIAGGVDAGATGALSYAGAPIGAAPAAGGDMTARAKRIRDGLIKRGFSPMMAAAAVGHGRQESSLNAAGPDGDSGSSSGLFQWRNERRAALQSFAAASGRNWQSEDAQLDFFVHELKTREKTAWTHLQGARNLDEATAALMHFERPRGYTVRNPRAGDSYANRLAYASWAASLGGAPAEAAAMAPEPPKTGAAAAIDKQIASDGRPQGSPSPASKTAPADGLRPFRKGEYRANEDGSYSTEVTVTVPDGNGKWMNVPSLWMASDGWVQLSEDDAADAAQRFEKSGSKFPRFGSLKEAESAAVARSQGGGVGQGDLAGSQKSAADHRITPDSVAPPAVTPISISAGQPGSFRPTGSITIRGRNYDAAGTRTYLQQLDATMRADADAVYARFKDDPAQLEEGFKALRTLHMQDHVFPEIQGDYDSAFASMTGPYVRKARADQEEKILAGNRASFIERTEALETDKMRSIATFDGEDGANALASAQSAIDEHYDSAVAHGVLDADDAAKSKITSRRSGAVDFYTRQAEKKVSPEEVAALRKSMREDFGSGKLAGVDGEAWQAIDAKLGAIEDAKRVDAKVSTKALADRGDALADAVLVGGSPSSPEISRFMLDAKTAPDGPAIVKKAMDRVAVAQLIRDKTLAGGEDVVRDLEARPDAQASGLAEYARKSFDGMKKAVEADPIGAAEARGLIAAQPDLFVPGDDAGTSGRMAARIASAETVAEHFGVRPKYLKPGEAAALKSISESDPDAAARIAGGLVGGGTGRATAILAELGNDAPAITQAGMILAGGGSARAARDVIAGYNKGSDGEKRTSIDNKVRLAGMQEVYGDAFAGAPEDGASIEAAGHSIAKVRIEQAGVDPKSEEAKAIYSQALQEAAGAVTVNGVQFGGITSLPVDGWFGSNWGATRVRVMVPPSIRADRFADVVDAIRDEDLVAPSGERGRVTRYFRTPPVDAAGKPYRAADLKSARPVAVQGGYSFAIGDPASDDPQWIRGADGRPFVLAIDAMRSRLEARVPGAYR